MTQYDYPADTPGVDPLSGCVTDPDAYLEWIRGMYLLESGVHTVADGRVIDKDTGCVVGTVEECDEGAYVKSVNIPRLLC